MTNESHSGEYFRDNHTVVLVRADGFPIPKHEVKYVNYYLPNSEIKISRTTKEIIGRYSSMK